MTITELLAESATMPDTFAEYIVETLATSSIASISAPLKSYRAYDTATEWSGRPRSTAAEAQRDADRHNDECRTQGGYGSAIVAMRDPEAPGRLVSEDGQTIWPPHGTSDGAAQWVD